MKIIQQNKTLICKIIFGILLIILLIIVKNKFKRKNYGFVLKNFIYTAIGNFALRDFDISTMPLKNCNKSFKGNIWLISYADGDDVHHQNQHVVSASGLINCVNRVIMYKKNDIDPIFYEKNKKILTSHRGAGYWLWKPYFIDKTLREIPEGDYLIYLDSGIKINSNAIKIIEENLLKQQKQMILIKFDELLIKNVKRQIFNYFDIDRKEILYANRLVNGITIMENTKNVRNFHKRLLIYSQVPELIMDEPLNTKDQYPEFIDHSHDLAILAGMYYKYYKNADFIKIINWNDSNFFSYFHRRDPHKRVPLIGKIRLLDQDKLYPHDKNFNAVKNY
jgi:hypothetical protein